MMCNNHNCYASFPVPLKENNFLQQKLWSYFSSFIIYICHDNFVHTQLIAEIWEPGDIATHQQITPHAMEKAMSLAIVNSSILHVVISLKCRYLNFSIWLMLGCLKPSQNVLTQQIHILYPNFIGNYSS